MDRFSFEENLIKLAVEAERMLEERQVPLCQIVTARSRSTLERLRAELVTAFVTYKSYHILPISLREDVRGFQACKVPMDRLNRAKQAVGGIM